MKAQTLGTLLLKQNLTISTAESCTCGLLCSMIGEVSGASAWFHGGWVTYSNELKVSQLGVSPRLLKQYGAVSFEVAAAMVEGASKASGTDAGLSTTGIAGPTGGSEKKPVGTVFIGCKVNEDLQVRQFRFSGERNEIRIHAANTALQMLISKLVGEQVESMCCQHGDGIQF